MLKLPIIAGFREKIRHTAKNAAVWLILPVIFCAFAHPYYVSVTELKWEKSVKSMQMSCKLFTDNLEDALKKIYAKKVDLLHPASRAETEKLIYDYISKHLIVNVDGKTIQFKFIGYEKEEEAVWCYLEAEGIKSVKNIKVENTLLYEYLPQQINMMHVTVNGKRISNKVSNPEKKLSFSF